MGSERIKVLGMNASPRKYGNTYKLLEAALKGAEAEGAEAELLNLYDYDIKPCEACLSDEQNACRPPCMECDDAWAVLRKVLESDGLVIATPVYWYGPSGHLKNFIDKLTVFENMILVEGRSWLEGKVAGFIATGAEAGAVMTIAYLMAVLNSMGVHVPPWALAYYEGLGNALEREESLMDAVNVGRVVTIAAKELKRVKVWYDPQILRKLGGKENVVAEIEAKARKNEELQKERRTKLVKEMLAKDYGKYRIK